MCTKQKKGYAPLGCPLPPPHPLFPYLTNPHPQNKTRDVRALASTNTQSLHPTPLLCTLHARKIPFHFLEKFWEG
jgi:hypothetical protein